MPRTMERGQEEADEKDLGKLGDAVGLAVEHRSNDEEVRSLRRRRGGEIGHGRRGQRRGGDGCRSAGKRWRKTGSRAESGWRRGSAQPEGGAAGRESMRRGTKGGAWGRAVLASWIVGNRRGPVPHRPPRCAGAMQLKPGMSALVTGGGSGIGKGGKGLCIALAQKGLFLTIVDFSEENGAQVASLAQKESKQFHEDSKVPSAIFIKCDVTDADALAAAFGKHVHMYGGLDVCINCAGFISKSLIYDDTSNGINTWRRAVNVNLVAVVDGTRLATQIMRAQKKPGAVLNIGSVAGLYPMSYEPIYSGTKEDLDKLREMELFGEDGRDGVWTVMANVMEPESLHRAFDGCAGVFHTSAFVDPGGMSGYTKHMATLEAQAAERVIEACVRTESVRKCVFTSSLLACVWRQNYPHDRRGRSIIDENCWSDETFCRDNKLWSALGKTAAEKAAWRAARGRDLKLVTVCPALVTGPGFSRRNSTASIAYLKGSRAMLAQGVLATVNVETVAEAHVQAYAAMANNTAGGRYICYDRVIQRAEEFAELERQLGIVLSRTAPVQSVDDRPARFELCKKKLGRLMSSRRRCTYDDYYPVTFQ